MQEITNIVEVVEAKEEKKQESFDALSDEKLRDLIGRASHVLEQRIAWAVLTRNPNRTL